MVLNDKYAGFDVRRGMYIFLTAGVVLYVLMLVISHLGWILVDVSLLEESRIYLIDMIYNVLAIFFGVAIIWTYITVLRIHKFPLGRLTPIFIIYFLMTQILFIEWIIGLSATEVLGFEEISLARPLLGFIGGIMLLVGYIFYLYRELTLRVTGSVMLLIGVILIYFVGVGVNSSWYLRIIASLGDYVTYESSEELFRPHLLGLVFHPTFEAISLLLAVLTAILYAFPEYRKGVFRIFILVILAVDVLLFSIALMWDSVVCIVLAKETGFYQDLSTVEQIGFIIVTFGYILGLVGGIFLMLGTIFAIGTMLSKYQALSEG